MSTVSVHGVQTMYGGGAQNSTPLALGSPVFKVTPNPANGRIVTVTLLLSARAAADYDWTFGSGSSPATATDSKGPTTVTYSTDGAKTITLTVAAGAGPPAGGAYVVTYVANPGPAD